jgi:molecular chaperone HscB
MQSVDLSSSYFVLFSLPVCFDIDRKILAERYRQLQRTVHPDKFVNAADSERRLSVQMAARVNEGFQILKDPLARARYLLELQGIELDDMNTAFDGAFLMEQMELRERLGDVKESADPHQQLQMIAGDISARIKELTESMASFLREGCLAGDKDEEALQHAKDLTRKLQFFRRLEEEIDALDDELAGC